MPNDPNRVWVGRDCAFHNVAPGVVNLGTGTDKDSSGTLMLKQVVLGFTTVAKLPSAKVALKGLRTFVTDANATTFASTVAGGGSNFVPVFCDGSNWLIG